MSRRGTRRLRRRSRTCSPMGRSIALGRFPKGNEGKTQGRLPLGNPVCLWQTELFKLNLKSSPSSSGYNRRRRLATGRSGKQQAERTAVRAAPTTARIGTCHSMGGARGIPKGERKALWCARRRILLVPGGDWRADYGAGAGLAALWGVHTFLSVAKEKCAKESQWHGDSGKKPFTAHF